MGNRSYGGRWKEVESCDFGAVGDVDAAGADLAKRCTGNCAMVIMSQASLCRIMMQLQDLQCHTVQSM